MFKFKRKLKAIPSVIILLVVWGCKQPQKDIITIATAANMQFAIEEISKAFTLKTGVQCQLIISSSGKLTAQIKQGAPYDIFVSANMKYPEDVYNSDLALYPPKIYGYGQLVLWTAYDDIKPSVSLLTDESIQHIALANPKTAPYGEATIKALKHYKVYNMVKEKLVYGESIAQTNQFIISKSSEIGFTSKSVVLSSRMKNKGKWVAIDKKVHQPIDQGVVLIKRKNQLVKNAQEFYDFLFSAEAKEILEDFGYLVAQ